MVFLYDLQTPFVVIVVLIRYEMFRRITGFLQYLNILELEMLQAQQKLLQRSSFQLYLCFLFSYHLVWQNAFLLFAYFPIAEIVYGFLHFSCKKFAAIESPL